MENRMGKSVETKFDKSSILGKPPSDKHLINSQISKSWFIPKIVVQKDLSKPVTAQSLPKNEKDQFLKRICWELHYPIWEVIQNGNGLVSITIDTQGQIKVLPHRTAEEIVARERERKARTTLLMALPEDHLAKFHKMTDAKESGMSHQNLGFGGK
ncbi:hypothetical protein Tco_0403949 [Tanacetum coccineum]